MDIILRTNTRDPFLGLLTLRRFADGSGFCCQLAVRSHGFAGETLFWPEVAPVQEFASAIERMDRTLAGSARLQSLYEESFVELEATRTGAVLVRGELAQFQDAGTHRLQFAFRTDQTCLRPLADDLAACLRMAAV